MSASLVGSSLRIQVKEWDGFTADTTIQGPNFTELLSTKLAYQNWWWTKVACIAYIILTGSLLEHA